MGKRKRKVRVKRPMCGVKGHIKGKEYVTTYVHTFINTSHICPQG